MAPSIRALATAVADLDGARHRRRASLVLLLVASTACFVGRGTGGLGAHRGETELYVENLNWLDMRVTVVGGGFRMLLGEVTSNDKQRFRLPAMPGQASWFEAHPVGSDRVYVSPHVDLHAGDTFVWTLAANVEYSTLVRR